MKIDRIAFLALSASLAGTGCAQEEDSTGVGEGNMVTGGEGESERVRAHDDANDAAGFCLNPATESAKGPVRDFYVSQIGFDPVANFPAAESFCRDHAFVGDTNGGEGERVFDTAFNAKCVAYARVYQPLPTYKAFKSLKEKLRTAPRSQSEAFDLAYRVDREIVADQSFCRTEGAKAACASHPSSECERFAAQVKPSSHAKLKECIADGFPPFSCAEGASTL